MSSKNQQLRFFSYKNVWVERRVQYPRRILKAHQEEEGGIEVGVQEEVKVEVEVN